MTDVIIDGVKYVPEKNQVVVETFSVGDYVRVKSGELKNYCGKVVAIDVAQISVEFALTHPCLHDLHRKIKGKHGYYFYFITPNVYDSVLLLEKIE